jgi:DnaA family protein
MKQLVLDLAPNAPPRFENFIIGDNAELLRALADCVRGDGHLYLWGPSGSGRSHLLCATVGAAREAGRPADFWRPTTASAVPDASGALIAIDDADRLAPEAQIAVFNAFNRAATLHHTLVLAGNAPPRALNLREDLRTRIGQCLVFETRPLDDDTRARILATLAERRGMRLPADLVNFLLRHGRRDLPSLVATVEALDTASLERKRPITLALLREVMQPDLP